MNLGEKKSLLSQETQKQLTKKTKQQANKNDRESNADPCSHVTRDRWCIEARLTEATVPMIRPGVAKGLK